MRLLVTRPKWLEKARREFESLDVTVVDFDKLLLDRLIESTSNGKPSWEVVTRADAGGPAGGEWAKLHKLLDREIAAVTDSLFAIDGTVVLHSVGLLARYDRVNQIAQWREQLHNGDGALDGLWLLIPGADASAAPMLGNEAVPVVGPGYWRHVPGEWLTATELQGVRDD